MIVASDREAWRRAGAFRRAEIIARWRDAVMADRRALSAVWAEAIGVSPRAAFEHEVLALAAALDELASVGASVLEPTTTRRWLGGERVQVRVESKGSRVVRAGPDASPAEVLAWVACALLAGGAVRLSADGPSIAALERALLGLDPDGQGVPLERAWSGSAPSEEAWVTDAFGTVEAPSDPAGRRAPSRPALAWIDDALDVDARGEALLRGARYGAGRLRGALRAVFGRSSSIDPLWASLARRTGQQASRVELSVEGVRLARDPEGVWDESPGPSLTMVSLDEPAYVALATERGPWSAACGFGRDEDRARSLAARSDPEVIFVNATPACGLGGILRAEFDARRWLQAGTRSIPVATGPTPWIARAGGEGGSRSRSALSDGWARVLLGRHGLGGAIEDLG